MQSRGQSSETFLLSRGFRLPAPDLRLLVCRARIATLDRCPAHVRSSLSIPVRAYEIRLRYGSDSFHRFGSSAPGGSVAARFATSAISNSDTLILLPFSRCQCCCSSIILRYPLSVIPVTGSLPKPPILHTVQNHPEHFFRINSGQRFEACLAFAMSGAGHEYDSLSCQLQKFVIGNSRNWRCVADHGGEACTDRCHKRAPAIGIEQVSGARAAFTCR